MRKFVSVLLATVIVLSLTAAVISPASAAGDEIRAAKRVISVVYDDSGSMAGARWVYTNYAMQALTALLNQQDELYISFMSDPYSVYSVAMDDLPGAVADIREWASMGNTPGETLDTARDVLDDCVESDPSVQYWLVILTDGAIGISDSLQSHLNGYKGQIMPNGSALNTAYLAIGVGAVPANGDPSDGLHTFDAEDGSDITVTMGEMANLISSRLTADKITQADATTLSFSSALPMYSISVLSQNSPASVVSAGSPEGALDIDRNIGLDAYDPFGYDTLTLQGNAAVIHSVDDAGLGRVIPAGTYTVTFSQSIRPEDVVIQYEPAIGMDLVITRSGVEVTDPNTLAADDKVTIELIPVIPGTNTPIEQADLPGGMAWSAEYLLNDTVIDHADGTTLRDVILQTGDGIVRGIMQIPGFAPTVYEVGFSIPEIVYEYTFGIEVTQPDPLVYQRKTLRVGNAGSGAAGSCVTFAITDAGQPLPADVVRSLDLKLELVQLDSDNSMYTKFLDTFGKTPVKCDLVRNDDGTFSLVPQAGIPFTAFLLKAGDYTATVQLNADPSVTAVGTFHVEPHPSDWIDLWILILILLVLIYLIYIIFIKYKFSNQTIRMEVYKLLGTRGSEMKNRSRSVVLSPLSGGLLLPTRACTKKFNGLVLQAGPDGLVLVTGKSIAKRAKFYTISSSDPESSLGSIVSSMRSTEKKVGNRIERSAPDQTVSTSRAIYFRSSANDTQIWRILQHSKKGRKR